MLRIWLLALAPILLAAPKLPKPDRIPTPPTPEQVKLVQEGVRFHDRKEYAEAIARYKQVLAENPWELTALHELAFTYFESKDYENALATALRGSQCRSRLLPVFYASIGNALDELGRGKEAIETYKAAIKQNPGIGLLHYNLAVSLRRAQKPREAKASAQKGIDCDPNHPGSHLTLAFVYQDMGYRIPAILAYSRFLVLEPDSARARNFLRPLLDLLTRGVEKGTGPNQINITVSEPGKGRKDEGDFMPVEMMVSIGMAADLMAAPEKLKNEPKSPFQKLVAIYTSIGEALDALKPQRGFAATHYGPYFASLTKAGHVEAFVAHTWKTAGIEGSTEWTQANADRLDAFRSWSKAYAWPGK